MTQIRQNWFQLTSIQIGIIICLPAIMLGNLLYNMHGLRGALMSLGVGSVLAFSLALVQLKLSMAKRLTIAEYAQHYFGKLGIYICGFALCVASCGWFSIQLGLMSKTVGQFFGTDQINLISLGLGLLITVLVSKGIKMIEYFADLALPLMGVTLGYLLMTSDPTHAELNYGVISVAGVPLVLSSILSGIVKLPNYFRFARSFKDGLISIILIYLVGAPLVALVGLALSIAKPDVDIITILNGDGTFLWSLWVTIFLVIAGWTTNNGNLYSGSVAISPFIGHYRWVVCILGIFSTGLTLLGITTNYIQTLNIMGTTMGAMGTVIMLRFILNGVNEEDHVLNFLCFTHGVSAAALHLAGAMQITPFFFLDGMLVTALSILFLECNRWSKEIFHAHQELQPY